MGVMKRLVGIKLSGDKALLRKFGRMQKNIMSAKSSKIILNAGCGILSRATSISASAVARDTGLLAKNIIVKYLKHKYPDKRTAIIGVRSKLYYVRRTKKGTWRGVGRKQVSKSIAAGDNVRRVNPGNYAHLVEYGSGPRRPKKKKAMKTPFGFIVNAKGTQARPFMRPAFDATSGIALGAMESAMQKAILKEMRGMF